MTEQTRILVLGSYPYRRPTHGGQIRLAAIVEAYRAAGFAVDSACVFSFASAADQPIGNDDFDFPADSPFRLWHGRAVPLVEDLLSGDFAASDDGLYHRLTAVLQRAQPDIIHFEQPWLFPLVRRWRAEGRIAGTRLVYGSQNIEAPLKLGILRQYGITEAEAVAAEIAALEAEACRASDWVLAVSQADQRTLQDLCEPPVILAANGISPWQASADALAAWKKKLPAEPFALFVASAHPPNIAGFFDTLGCSMGFLPPDRKLYIAGSVGPHILAAPEFARWEPLNRSRVMSLGLLDADDLAAVKSLAHVFVLPISQGAGSNIKTAEAIYSGKHVLGTRMSFRGFEFAMGMEGIHVADSPAEFRTTLAALLQRLPLAPADQGLRAQVLWPHTLQPMVDIATGSPSGD